MTLGTGRGSPPRFLRLGVYARPARFAVVQEDGPDWIEWLERFFVSIPRIWGGAGALLMPSTASTSDAWTKLLQPMDVDRVMPLYRTLRGRFLNRGDEQLLAEEVERLAVQLAAGSGIPVDVFRNLVEHDLDQPGPGHGLPGGFADWITLHGSPLDFVGRPGMSLGAEVPHEFVDVLALDRSDQMPLRTLDLRGLSKYLRLLALSRVGGVDRWYWADEQGAASAPTADRVAARDVESLIYYSWLGDATDRSFSLREALAEAAQKPVPPRPAWSAEAFRVNTPMERSLLGCIRLFPAIDQVWEQRPFYVVIGDVLEDFCLYYTFNQMWSGAAWLPTTWVTGRSSVAKAARSALTDALLSITGRGYEREVIFTSSSKSIRSLEHCRSILMRRINGSLRSRSQLSEQINPVRSRMLIADAEVWDQARFAPFHDDVQGDQIETPMPSRVRPKAGKNFSWFVDVAIEGYKSPMRGVMRDLLAANPQRIDRHTIRPSSIGTSYWTEGLLRLAGQPLARSVNRPRLRTPGPSEILEALLRRDGMTFAPSDKGNFSRAAIEIWGGLESFVTDLQEPTKLAFLEAFRKRTNSGVDPGVYLAASRRRYLQYADATTVTALTDQLLRPWLDELTAKGILTAGLILQCGVCRYAGWYPPEKVAQTFSCLRCRTVSALSMERWKEPPAGPLWHYELAEVVYQALDADCRAVALSLYELYSSKRDAFAYSTEFDVLDDQGGHVCEVDFFAVLDGAICVGEAKTANRLGTNEAAEGDLVRKLRRVAAALTADRVVFGSTAKADWRPATRAVANAEFQGSSIDIQWLGQLGFRP